MDGRTVTLTLAEAATAGQAASVTYTKPAADPLWDRGKHNQAEGFDVLAANITGDTTPPSVQGAFVSGDVIERRVRRASGSRLGTQSPQF